MAVTVNLCPVPKLQFSQNGVPLAGGKLFTYAAGTSTKQATYADAAGTTTNSNPIILDANGQCDCFLEGGVAYKLVLAPSTDTDPPTNPYWTEDQVTGINQVLSTFGPETGVANAYVVTLTPAITSYADGQQVVFDASNTNTGASTLNVNGLGPKQLLVAGAATLAGAIKAGQRYVFSYSTTLGAFVQLGTSLADLVGSSLNISGNAVISGTTTLSSITSGASGSSQPGQMQQMVGEGAGAYGDVTSSRAVNTLYTNNTGRPLIVLIVLYLSASSTVFLQASSSTATAYVYDVVASDSTLYGWTRLFAVIPPGDTYYLATTGTQGFGSWREY